MPLETTHHNETSVTETKEITNFEKELINPKQVTKEIGPKFVQFLAELVKEHSGKINKLDTMSEEQLINGIVGFINVVSRTNFKFDVKTSILQDLQGRVSEWCESHGVSEQKLIEKISNEMNQEQLSKLNALLNTI